MRLRARLSCALACCALPVVCVADATVSYTYDALGRLTRLDLVEQASVTYTLDAAGNRSRAVASAVARDADGDGVADARDLCPLRADPAQLDLDGDGLGDACDADDDNDGVADVYDAFPLRADEWADTDRDGLGDNADADDDNDSVADATDNCVLVANPDQRDTDADGAGDACDETDDTCWECLPGTGGWRAILK